MRRFSGVVVPPFNIFIAMYHKMSNDIIYLVFVVCSIDELFYGFWGKTVLGKLIFEGQGDGLCEQ